MLRQTSGILFVLGLYVLLAFAQTPTEAAVKGPLRVVAQADLSSLLPGDTAKDLVPAGTQMLPGQIDARSAILVEVSTGVVIYEQNADEPIEPASFTKILTLYLVNEALGKGTVSLEDEVYISESAWRTSGSKMFVEVGTKVPLREIIKGIAVVSGNDASVAAGEHLAGSLDAFVDAMNKKSTELGMNRSRFLNPHGLPAEGQITTARDMATMNREYLRNFKGSLQVHSIQEYTYNDITQQNRNRLLLRDRSVDGLKTGYVSAAGYHLAATAEQGGMRLLAVVMGAPSAAVREREAMKLLNFGFRSYAIVKPFSETQQISTVKVWKGEKDEVSLYPSELPDIIIAQADRGSLRWDVRTPADVTAPIPAGTKLGEVVFYVSDRPYRTVPLINRVELIQAGWFKRGWQSVFRMVTFGSKAFAIGTGVVLILILLVIVIARRRSAGRSRSSLIR